MVCSNSYKNCKFLKFLHIFLAVKMCQMILGHPLYTSTVLLCDFKMYCICQFNDTPRTVSVFRRYQCQSNVPLFYGASQTYWNVSRIRVQLFYPLNYSVLATSASISSLKLVYDSSIDNSVAQQQNNNNDELNICIVVRYTIARVVYRHF